MLETLKAKLAELYAREPARVNAAVVTGILAAAGAIGLVVAPAALVIIGSLVALVVPLVIAELTRPKVVPVVVAEEVAEVAFQAGADAEASKVPSPIAAAPADSLGP